MMTLLDGFDDRVVAVRAEGTIIRADYERVLIPRIEQVAAGHPKLRCYYEIDADPAAMTAGAMWDDFRVGVEFWTRWERIAVVTDSPWMSHMVNAFRFLVPGAVRLFGVADRDAAKRWIEE